MRNGPLTWLLGGLTCALLGAGGMALAQPRPTEHALSPEAHASMRPRMKQHGPEMEQLIWSVILLQRNQTRVLADHIAGAERLARPLPGQLDTINAEVPELFFALQDTLRDRAEELRDAAAKGDNDAVASAFGRLAESCVACHTRYLE